MPGWREVETIPWSPNRRASSVANTTFPYETLNCNIGAAETSEKLTYLLWKYNFEVEAFFRAGPSLNVSKFILEALWPIEDVLTTRALPSGEVLAVERRTGTKSLVR